MVRRRNVDHNISAGGVLLDERVVRQRAGDDLEVRVQGFELRGALGGGGAHEGTDGEMRVLRGEEEEQLAAEVARGAEEEYGEGLGGHDADAGDGDFDFWVLVIRNLKVRENWVIDARVGQVQDPT